MTSRGHWILSALEDLAQKGYSEVIFGAGENLAHISVSWEDKTAHGVHEPVWVQRVYVASHPEGRFCALEQIKSYAFESSCHLGFSIDFDNSTALEKFCSAYAVTLDKAGKRQIKDYIAEMKDELKRLDVQ